MLFRLEGPSREFDRNDVRARWRSPRVPMDAYRRGDAFYVHFDLPGVDPSAVDLTVDQNMLTLSAERSWPSEEGDNVIINERPQGRFRRQLMLGESLDSESMTANFARGVLTLTIPVAVQGQPRKVVVTSDDSEADVSSPPQDVGKHGIFHRHAEGQDEPSGTATTN